MTTSYFASKPRVMGLFYLVFMGLLTGCTQGQFFGMSIGTTSALPQIEPSSTTLNTGQSLSFQVSGGTPPYQFQLSGVGSLNSAGYYLAGNTTGQAQIQVTDASSNMTTATVSVVQAGSTNLSNSVNDNQWRPTTAQEQKKNPLIAGNLVAVDQKFLDAKGDSVVSQFVQTHLQHPLVRMDELIEQNQVVAVHAVIEDQFIVKLEEGYSEQDLAQILKESGAHLSKKLPSQSIYLVSMDKPDSATEAGVSPTFLAKRAQLKKNLQTIARVSPNFVSRAPANDP